MFSGCKFIPFLLLYRSYYVEEFKEKVVLLRLLVFAPSLDLFCVCLLQLIKGEVKWSEVEVDINMFFQYLGPFYVHYCL